MAWAFNDWILDNGLTPYLSVNAEYDGVEVPKDFVMDGEIVLNISPASVRNLELGQEYIIPGADEYQLMVEHFADVVLEKTELMYPVEDSIGNMQVLDALAKAACTGKTIKL